MRPSLLVFLLSVKSATLAGWFSDADVQELQDMFKNVLNHFLVDGECWKPSPQSSVLGSTVPSEAESFMSMICSMYFPRLTILSIIVSLTTKPGYESHGCDFQVASQLVSATKLRLFVCQKDDVRTAACLVTPRHLSFLVNGKGVEKRYYVAGNPELGPQFPSDITSMLRIGCNFLQVVGDCTGPFFVAVAIMGFKPWSSASAQLEDYVNPSPAAEADEEVIVGQSRVSLRCPISHQRIITPVKGIACKHHQAFDYDSYVEINDRKPTWRCPCCHSYVNCLELRFDRQTKQILAEVDENVFEVMFNHDGSWALDVPADGDRAANHSGQSQAERVAGIPDGVIDLSDDDDDGDSGVGRVATSSAGVAPSGDFDIVDRKPDIRLMRIGEGIVTSDSRHSPVAVDASNRGADRSPGLHAPHSMNFESIDRAGPASVAYSRGNQNAHAPVLVALQNPLVTVSPRSPAFGSVQPSLPTNAGNQTSDYWLSQADSQLRSQAGRSSILQSSMPQVRADRADRARFTSAAHLSNSPSTGGGSLPPLPLPTEIPSFLQHNSDMADILMLQDLQQQPYTPSSGQQALPLNPARTQQNAGHQAVRQPSTVWNGAGSAWDARNFQTGGVDLHQSSQGYHNANQQSLQHLANGQQQPSSSASATQEFWQRHRVALQLQQALQTHVSSNPRGSPGGGQVGLGSISFGAPLFQNGGAQQGSHSRTSSHSAHLVGMHLASIAPAPAMSGPNPRVEGWVPQQDSTNWRTPGAPRMRGAISSGTTAGVASSSRIGSAPSMVQSGAVNRGRTPANVISRFPETMPLHVSTAVTADPANGTDPYFAQEPLTTDSLMQDLSWTTQFLDTNQLDNNGLLSDSETLDWLDDDLFLPPSTKS